MSWGQPWFLGALVVPVIAILLRRGRRSTPSSLRLMRAAIRGARVEPAASEGKSRAGYLPLAVGLAMVALAQPRWGVQESTGEEPAREVMIALDLSRSMLVTDVAPSRLQRAQALVRAILDRLHGERVGLVVFAGTAYVQVPLSSDYQIIREFLPVLEPGYLPQGGSDYTGMLRAVREGFGESAGSDRTLFVLSDGESTTEGWQAELAELKRSSVTVVALGIGTAEGGPVPPAVEGEKSPARSRLEPGTLRSLAAETGLYREAGAALDVGAVLAESVALGQKARWTRRQTEEPAEQFAWFLVPAVGLALVGLWREVPVRPRGRALTRVPVQTGYPPGTMVQLALVGAAALAVWSRPARAHDEGHTFSPEATSTDKLVWLVEDLAQHRRIDARDLALLGERTVNYGLEMLARGQAVPEGPVRDALAAVEFGEKLQPAQADWTTLRSTLKRFLARTADETTARPPEQKKEALDEEDRPSQTNGQGSQQTTSESMGQGGVAKTDAALGELRKESTRRARTEKTPGQLRPGSGPSDPLMEGATRDPLRALTLKRYREVVKGDTPGVLFQALNGDGRTEAAGGRDW
jgi:Ca-activated chloride channel family protein